MEIGYQDIVKVIRDMYQTEEAIPLHEPKFTGNEKMYMSECIESTFVSSVGVYVDRFEQMVADYTGAKYAIATVNGTSALHIALLVAGVKDNDEVVTQPLSFIAICCAISYCRAKPIFVDVSRSTLGMSPDDLRQFLEANTMQTSNGCINKKTGRRIAAVVPMHTYGHPCRIDEIAAICQEFGIALVEDAAESLGSTYKNRHTGTFGLLGAISFNGNKTITTGGGGMIITDNQELAKRAKHITTTAKLPHPTEFIHSEVGFNYRMPNINAALGCAQMEKLGKLLASKRAVSEEYKAFFEGTSIDYASEPSESVSNYWLNTIILESKSLRDRYLEEINSVGVMVRPAWRLMDRLEMFKDCQTTELTNANWLVDRILNIPSSARLA